jgi:hypothetical protein
MESLYEDHSAYRILLIIDLLEGEGKVKMKRMGKCGNRLGYKYSTAFIEN